MNKILTNLRSAPRDVKILALLLFLIGVHSLLLGIFIFFLTELFYQLFFHAKIENIFFVKQSGLFLFCIGLFYFVPLVDFQRRHRLLFIVILTKLLAFAFLMMYSHLVPWPPAIILAAVVDGYLALALIFFYRNSWKSFEESGSVISP